MGYYRPGNHVHYIQARKAGEDPGSWRDVWIFEVGQGLLVVGDDTRERFALACLPECIPSRLRERLPLIDRLPAQFSSRWSLLRYDGAKLVSVRGPLEPDLTADDRLTAADWRALDQWRATAGAGCDSTLRPCACRPDMRTPARRRPRRRRRALTPALHPAGYAHPVASTLTSPGRVGSLGQSVGAAAADSERFWSSAQQVVAWGLVLTDAATGPIRLNAHHRPPMPISRAYAAAAATEAGPCVQAVHDRPPRGSHRHQRRRDPSGLHRARWQAGRAGREVNPTRAHRSGAGWPGACAVLAPGQRITCASPGWTLLLPRLLAGPVPRSACGVEALAELRWLALLVRRLDVAGHVRPVVQPADVHLEVRSAQVDAPAVAGSHMVRMRHQLGIGLVRASVDRRRRQRRAPQQRQRKQRRAHDRKRPSPHVAPLVALPPLRSQPRSRSRPDTSMIRTVVKGRTPRHPHGGSHPALSTPPGVAGSGGAADPPGTRDIRNTRSHGHSGGSQLLRCSPPCPGSGRS